MDYEAIEKLLAESCNFEGSLVQRGSEIREKSKLGYEQQWLDSRMMLIGCLNHMVSFRSGVPGKTNESISHRLILITSFIQGIAYTESLISEGQYIKAAACLKQDYEIITRISEIQKGVAKEKVTPNVKHAPPGTQRFYGELNDISHPSNINILLGLVSSLEDGEIKGVSPLPKYRDDVSLGLYQLHVWTLFEILRETVKLKMELYDDIKDELELVGKIFITVQKMFLESGFVNVPDGI